MFFSFFFYTCCNLCAHRFVYLMMKYMWKTNDQSMKMTKKQNLFINITEMYYKRRSILDFSTNVKPTWWKYFSEKIIDSICNIRLNSNDVIFNWIIINNGKKRIMKIYLHRVFLYVEKEIVVNSYFFVCNI
jgi:hypothetical protein